VFPRLQIDRIDIRSRDLISIAATSHAQSAQPPKVAQCSSDELCKAGGAALHSLTVMTGSSVLVATHSFCGCGQCGHMLACCLHLLCVEAVVELLTTAGYIDACETLLT
jgi:hypothetical protein